MADVNGTTFHLVIGRRGWLPHEEVPDGLAWHDPDQTLRLAEVPFVFPERPGNRRLHPRDRRGAARDAYGNWYWIGLDHREVRFQAAGARGSARYWPRDDECPAEVGGGDFTPATRHLSPPAPLAGLAVTADHRLIVGAPDLPGVLVFDLHAGGPPTPVVWPVPLRPVDMAAAPHGGVWILDGPAGPGPARYWLLDRHLAVAPLVTTAPPVRPAPDFRPTSGAQEHEEAATPPPAPAPVGAEWAIAIEALPDGSVLVLDRGHGGPPCVLRLDGPDEVARLPLAPLTEPVDLAVTPPAAGTGAAARLAAGSVLVADSRGDQVTAFWPSWAPPGLTPLLRYLPMRLFSGKALVAAGDEVLYDLGDRWLPLVDRRTPRYRASAVLELEPLVADEPGTVWNRLTLDARLPRGTGLRVESRAADEQDTLERSPWRDEPTPYLRGGGSEVGYHRFGRPGAADAGTWELLFQRAVGRRLQLRLSLTGDGRSTPRLWSLRAHAPRFSYLEQYLPDLYRDDEEAAHFLDRYLANVEGLLTTLEGRVAGAQALLDATTVDARFLPWLAGWLGASLDPTWDEARSRLLLQHAVALFGRRGTPRGLTEAVRLAVDPCPDSSLFDGVARPGFAVRVVEEFSRRARRAWRPSPDVPRPRLVADDRRWHPADGRSALDRRYGEHLLDRYGTAAALSEAWGREVASTSGGEITEPFPPLTPAGRQEAGDRGAFAAAALDVTYADVGPDDLPLWREFLARRYRRPERLQAAWGSAVAGVSAFDQVALPADVLPPDGVPLTDWVQFVAVHLPGRRSAHRFTVLVPVRLGATDEARADLLARVTAVVDRERPAHTSYSVVPYWAAFRVGEARVGLETSVGEGARFTPLVVGRGRLAEGHLSGRHPWDVPDRWVLGRDAVRREADEWRVEAGT